MPNVALSWQQAAAVSALLFTAALFLSRSRRAAARHGWPLLREGGLIAALYAIWQGAGTLSVLGMQGALARAAWILRAEHELRLPTELSVQHLVLPHPLLAQLCNLYYATMHFTALFALLLWLFIRHRSRYPRVRTTIVLLTLACLLIQFVPVAPPRLLPGHGFVDVAARFGQSVYGLGGFTADQLSAMPSVHVGWAVLVGLTVVRVSVSRWRWLALLHPVATVFVVVATGNHFWLDGVVAIVLLGLAESTQRLWGQRRAARRLVAAATVRVSARLGQALPIDASMQQSLQCDDRQP